MNLQSPSRSFQLFHVDCIIVIVTASHTNDTTSKTTVIATSSLSTNRYNAIIRIIHIVIQQVWTCFRFAWCGRMIFYIIIRHLRVPTQCHTTLTRLDFCTLTNGNTIISRYCRCSTTSRRSYSCVCTEHNRVGTIIICLTTDGDAILSCIFCNRTNRNAIGTSRSNGITNTHSTITLGHYFTT